MKVRVLLAIFLLSGMFCIADPYTKFESVTDFNATIKGLVTNPSVLSTEKLYLVEGTLSSINVMSSDPTNYYAEAVFFSSEWFQRRELKNYTIWIVFNSEKYASRILINNSQTDVPENPIRINTKGLALLQYVDTVTKPNGETGLVFLVKEYRSLDAN